MIDLSSTFLTLVKTILQQHVPHEEVRIFGSRVTGRAKPFSDIDLVIMNEQPLPTAKRTALREAFEESDLPYKTDIVEWCDLTEAFKQHLKTHYEIIQNRN